MLTASAVPSAIARENTSIILRRLADVGQARLAEQLGVSESTVSRWKQADIEHTAMTLAALGLRVVADDAPYIGKAQLEALIELADRGLEAMREAQREP